MRQEGSRKRAPRANLVPAALLTSAGPPGDYPHGLPDAGAAPEGPRAFDPPPRSDAVLKKVIPVEDAISVLHDGDVLATTGYGGHGVPEQLLVTLEKRFVETGTPRRLSPCASKARRHVGSRA